MDTWDIKRSKGGERNRRNGKRGVSLANKWREANSRSRVILVLAFLSIWLLRVVPERQVVPTSEGRLDGSGNDIYLLRKYAGKFMDKFLLN